jgi:hypothetical protein
MTRDGNHVPSLIALTMTRATELCYTSLSVGERS